MIFAHRHATRRNSPAVWVERIGRHLPRHMQMAARDTVAELAGEVETVLQGPEEPVEVLALLTLAVAKVNDIGRARGIAREHRAALAACATPEAERRALETILAQERSGSLFADRQALGRWMDAEAITDRDADRLQRLHQSLEILATYLAAAWRAPCPDDPPWQTDSANTPRGIDTCLGPLANVARTTTEPWTLRVALVEALCAAGARLTRWRRSVAQMLLDQIASSHDDPWVVACALHSYVQEFAELEEGRDLVREVVLPAESRASFFKEEHCLLRGRAVALCAQLGDWQTIAEVLERPDPSEHVRCEAMRALAGAREKRAAELLSERLLSPDRETNQRVRATGAVALFDDSAGIIGQRRIALVGQVLASEDSTWVLETLIDTIFVRRPALLEEEDAAEEIRRCWTEPLARCASDSMPMDLRQRAASLLHWAHLSCAPETRAALSEVESWTRTAREGEARRFTNGAVAQLDTNALTRVLVVAATDTQDLAAHSLRGGYRLVFGARRAWAPWRTVHELLHRAPDKRQAHNHTHDLMPLGRWVALSARMSEVTPSRVPGRRVSGPAQLDWGSELPLPAFVVAGCAGGVELLTPLERVSVQPQGGRLPAWWRIQRHYVRLARARQSLLQQSRHSAAAAYDRTLAGIGFSVERRPWLMAALPWPDLPDLVPLDWVHTDDTTLGQLALFGTGLGLYWVGRSMFTQWSIRRLRRQIPLVVGGWGSRGKSGTERLKAALFHGLGYRVLCKTTGCEASFLATSPGAEPVEILLYRSYDKPSIWEQIRFLRIAAQLSAQVVLWECMALTPDYVRVLQRDWMRDDFSTITNTYPDHEDIQGPAGRDVAEAIGAFIAPNSRAFTSEQHMTPVLRESAREKNTQLEECTIADWRLLPADLMARFPYAAHPRNVALVVKLGEHLGMPRDVVLRAMADHVLPDVGVLKEFGPVTYEGRSLSFVNGMSANERAGCLSNWQRMKLGVIPEGSGLWERVVILVNNRADRLSRQSMFARICAADLSADSIVIVGTNVAAFHRELREQQRELVHDAGALPRRLWLEMAQRHLRRSALSPGDALALAERWQSPLPEPVADWAVHLKQISNDPEALSAELMRARLMPTTDTTEGAVIHWLTEVVWLWSLTQKPDPFAVGAAADALLHVLASRTVLVDDPSASGDAIVDAIALGAPPASSTRIYGVQNIKGTGLDFVHRWLSVDRVERWLADLAAEHPRELWRDTLAQIATYQSFGVMDAVLVARRLDDANLRGRMAMAGLAVQVEQAVENARRGEAAARDRLIRPDSRSKSWITTHVLAGIERFLDSMDSIRRARMVDRVYEDLAHRRVGQQRAASVVRAVHERQKGGWLKL